MSNALLLLCPGDSDDSVVVFPSNDKYATAEHLAPWDAEGTQRERTRKRIGVSCLAPDPPRDSSGTSAGFGTGEEKLRDFSPPPPPPSSRARLKTRKILDGDQKRQRRQRLAASFSLFGIYDRLFSISEQLPI